MHDKQFEQRLDRIAQQWQAQRYTGPAPTFESRRSTPAWLWGGAVAAALLVALLLQPQSPTWPEQLRPVLRGSPLAVNPPQPPAAPLAFRLPGAPARPSCFSQNDACDQPAG